LSVRLNIFTVVLANDNFEPKNKYSRFAGENNIRVTSKEKIKIL
jgi:hypothetical protein